MNADPATPNVAEEPAVEHVAIDPASGEVVDLTAATSYGDLIRHADRAAELIGEVARFRQRIVDEVARRLDRQNTRSGRFDGWVIETNAPASDEYLLDVLERELKELVDDDVIDAEVLERVIVQPPPTPQARKVDRREVNKLKATDDRRVLGAVAAARQRKPNTRTLKAKRLEPGGQA